MMGYRYLGGIGAIFTFFFHGLEYVYPFALTCLGCGACREVCPLDIDVPTMVEKLRQRFIQAKYVTPPYADMVKSIRSYNNPFGEAIEKRFTK
jgi:L-lactate dehydrogenase complex protein LldG